MSLLCVAPGCRVPRQHTPDCTGVTVGGEQCRGCLPALAEVGQLCERCFARLRTWLTEIPDLYDEVTDPPTVSDRRTYTPGRHTPECVALALAHQREPDEICRGCAPGNGPARDPVGYRTPAGLVLSQSHQPRVSGSTDTQLAARFNEAGAGSVRLYPDRRGRIYIDDQIGDPPALVLLDSWAQAWQAITDEPLPDRAVTALCRWLSARLDRLVRHDRVLLVSFIDEVRQTRDRLWRSAGHAEPRPELCVGVPCRRCDLLSLWRAADGSGEVECHNPDCRTVYKPVEFQRWVALVAAACGSS